MLPAIRFGGTWYGKCKSFLSSASYFRADKNPYSSPTYLNVNSSENLAMDEVITSFSSNW